MKSAGKARNDGLYRHIRTSKEIIRNLLNDYYRSTGILQSGNKKSLPNVKLSSDTWRRRWDSPAPLQQSAGLLQPGGTQSAGHGLFESHLATLA